MKVVASTLALSMLLSACAEPSARIGAQSPASLAASVAVAEQVRRCYRRPRVPSVGHNIVTRLLVRYTADGGLVGLPVLVSQQGVDTRSRLYASRVAEAAKLAVLRCSPVRLPPEQGRKRGSDFLLTFSPRQNA